MARKKKGELPSGSIRRQIYDHSEPQFDKNGNPIIDPKTGKQKMKRIYRSITASSASEADLIKAEIKAGKKALEKPCDMSLSEAIEKYISSSDALLSPSTIRGYRTIQRNAFRTIMSTPLNALTNDLLRNAVNAECKRTTGKANHPKQISSKTVINEYGLISAVLNMYVPSLDCSVKLPQIEHNKHELSTPDVIYSIVKGTDIELPVLLAMWLSFTASEIQGLTKSKSLSADGCYITIKEVIVYDENNKPVIKNKGKQPTRDRTLRIPDYIRQLIDRVPTDKLVPLSSNSIYKRFRKLISAAGIPYMTFHDLRHVNASVMTILNVPDKYAQERGGWRSDHIMKSTYMQTFSAERASVDEQIDSYMEQMIDGKSSCYEKKLACWLTLFDLQDTPDNRSAFDLFCQNNSIKT